MKQEVNVLAKFKIGKSLPEPVRFQMVEEGTKIVVDIYSVLSTEYIGMNRIDFECNSLSQRGNFLCYTLSYYRKEGKWVFINKDDRKNGYTVHPK